MNESQTGRGKKGDAKTTFCGVISVVGEIPRTEMPITWTLLVLE